MNEGSVQLRRFLKARREGMSLTSAAMFAPMSLDEARLTDNDMVEGLLDHITTDEMPSRVCTQATEAAPVDTTIQRDCVNGVSGQGGMVVAPMDGPASPQQGDDAMPKHDEPATRPEDFDPLIEMAAETLRGDIRDSLIDWFKAQPKSWPFMSEREQKDLATAIDSFAYGLIRKATKIIAAGERPTIVARLVEYKEKDGVEAKLKLASTGEVVAQLHEACGQDVLLVASGAEDFNGQRSDPDIDPDQRKLRGIGDEYDEAA